MISAVSLKGESTGWKELREFLADSFNSFYKGLSSLPFNASMSLLVDCPFNKTNWLTILTILALK